MTRLVPINAINQPQNTNHPMVLTINKLTTQAAPKQKTRLEIVPAFLSIGSLKMNLAPNIQIWKMAKARQN